MQSFDRQQFASMIKDRMASERITIVDLVIKLDLGRTTLARLRAGTGALPNVTTYLKVKSWLESPRGGKPNAVDVGCVQYGK